MTINYRIVAPAHHQPHPTLPSYHQLPLHHIGPPSTLYPPSLSLPSILLHHYASCSCFLFSCPPLASSTIVTPRLRSPASPITPASTFLIHHHHYWSCSSFLPSRPPLAPYTILPHHLRSPPSPTTPASAFLIHLHLSPSLPPAALLIHHPSNHSSRSLLSTPPSRSPPPPFPPVRNDIKLTVRDDLKHLRCGRGLEYMPLRK